MGGKLRFVICQMECFCLFHFIVIYIYFLNFVFSCVVSILACCSHDGTLCNFLKQKVHFHYPVPDQPSRLQHDNYIQQNIPFVFSIVFISGMQNEWWDLRNYKQCVSVGLVPSVALVTNDIKISLRTVGVASGTIHLAPHTFRDY